MPANINYSGAAFRELLQIRSSSDLFHMSTLAEVQQNLSFLNTGPNQTPGLIVMKLDSGVYRYRGYNHLLVAFNATNAAITFTDTRLTGLQLRLHPVQQQSNDPATHQSAYDSGSGSVTVPALTTAVFVGTH
jgi:pullulanase